AHLPGRGWRRLGDRLPPRHDRPAVRVEVSLGSEGEPFHGRECRDRQQDDQPRDARPVEAGSGRVTPRLLTVINAMTSSQPAILTLSLGRGWFASAASKPG